MKISANKKRWRAKFIDENRASYVKRKYGLSDFLAKILVSKLAEDQDIDHFLNPKLKYLMPDPYHLLDMDKAVQKTWQAMQDGAQICIFADYDVDGATSSSLLKKFFADLAVQVDIYVPDRLTEGYGPSKIGLQKIKDRGTSLVITVDCGTMAHEALEFARAIGLEVIVIDHHLNNDILPEAVAIVNPNRLDQISDYGYLAAVGVTFLFVAALLAIWRKHNVGKAAKIPDLLSYLDLVALGTVCDVMPLTKLNRAYVAQGIKMMSKMQNLGIKALYESSGVKDKIDCFHLGYVFGPRINAGGRVGRADLGANLLAANCFAEAQRIASELEKHNNERRVIELTMQEEAMLIAETQLDNNFFFVVGQNWHPGVIGIIASRIKDKYDKPVAVIAVNEGIGKASCRSIKNIDFGVKILKAKEKNLLIVGGGHAMAAGFTATEAQLPALQRYLEDLFAEDFAVRAEQNFSEYSGELTTSSLNNELLAELAQLEPYGVGNYEPLFKIANLFVLKADIVGGKHIKCTLAPTRSAHGSKAVSAIAFNSVDTEIEKVLLSRKPLDIDAIGTLKQNIWQGNCYIQLHIKDLIVNNL